jgi:hypothetical protein
LNILTNIDPNLLDVLYSQYLGNLENLRNQDLE